MVFKKGEVGNPKGPKIGTRRRISNRFLKDIEAYWELNGSDVLEAACKEDPMKFVSMIADLLPKEATINVNETVTLQSQTIQALDSWIEGTFRRVEAINDADIVPH